MDKLNMVKKDDMKDLEQGESMYGGICKKCEKSSDEERKKKRRFIIKRCDGFWTIKCGCTFNLIYDYGVVVTHGILEESVKEIQSRP